MASRAELLGDVGDSAPEHWEECFRTRKAHVLVMISAKDGEALAERDRRIREAIARAGGVSAVVTQVGSALPTGREHFGYADGFSQPAIEGSRFPDHPGAGAPAKQRRVAADPRRRVHPRLPRRAGRAARRAAARRAQPQRLLRRLPQAAPGRRHLPAPAARGRRAVPGPGGAAGRQARRPLARRHAARLLTPSRGPGAGGRQVPQQRLRLRSRPERACAARSARTSAA